MMTREHLCVLLLVGSGAVVWLGITGRAGYSGNNAMIVARSVSAVAAIEGEVEGLPVKVGSKVTEGDLLVHIKNGRIDRSRLADLESQLEFYRSEIATAGVERRELGRLLEHFEKQAASYSTWLVQDLRLRREEASLALARAVERDALKSADNERTMELAKRGLVSRAVSESAQAEATIARAQVEALKGPLARIELMLEAIEEKGVPREDGDTSYWEKSVDAIRMRLVDNENRTASLRAEMVKAQSQANEERQRVSLNFVEEHRAPVSGVVSAIFTTVGKHVTAGDPMLEILDCAHPIAIVAIPDNRFGEFRIGQQATVMPIDSKESFAGSIQLISSGPLIGRDTTISIQQAATIDGNKAIVALEDKFRLDETSQACNSARRAVVTIHTPSLVDRFTRFASARLKSMGMGSVLATAGR